MENKRCLVGQNKTAFLKINSDKLKQTVLNLKQIFLNLKMVFINLKQKRLYIRVIIMIKYH